MGTRNLTKVIYKQKTKIAQYGQWDGYPEGQGAKVLRFLKKNDMETFKKRLDNVKFLSSEELEDKLKSIDITTEWIDINQDEDLEQHFPEIHRDTAAEILQLVYDGKATELKNDESFLEDGLFCEWAYVIDLDQNKLYVMADGNNIVGTFSIDNLPEEKQFVESLNQNHDKT